MKKKQNKIIKATLNSVRAIRRNQLSNIKKLDEMIAELKLYGYITE